MQKLNAFFKLTRYEGMRDEQTREPAGGGELTIRELRWRWKFMKTPLKMTKKTYIGSWDKAGAGSGSLFFKKKNETYEGQTSAF